MKTLSQIQLGKKGITDNLLETLKDHFKNHENVKISVLKSAGHDKKKVKEYSEEILNALGKNYTVRTLGFTIFIKKWRRKIR
jgi:RNA-binding protein YhbY